MIVIDLPWPPKELSPNARKHWRAISPIKRRYRTACALVTLAAGQGKLTGRHSLHIEFFPPNRRPRDRDNLLASIKFGLDGMADALGINDKHFDPVTITMREEIGPKVRITIQEVSNG